MDRSVPRARMSAASMVEVSAAAGCVSTGGEAPRLSPLQPSYFGNIAIRVRDLADVKIEAGSR